MKALGALSLEELMGESSAPSVQNMGPLTLEQLQYGGLTIDQKRESNAMAPQQMTLQDAYAQMADERSSVGRIWNQAMGGLGGTLVRTGQQLTGDFAGAQDTQRNIDMQSAANTAAGGVIENLASSVASSLVKVAYMGTAGSVAGVGAVPAMIGTFAADSYNSRKVEALDRGFSEAEATMQGLIAGGIEGGITAAFSMAGAGGLEQGFKTAIGKELAKALPKQILGEIREETAILIAQTAMDDFTAWKDFDFSNPEHSKQLAKDMAFTAAAAALGSAAVTSGTTAKAAQEFMANPTRAAAAKLGLHKLARNKAERESLAAQAAENVNNPVEGAAEPGPENLSPGEPVSQPPSPEQVSAVQSEQNALDGVSEPLAESPPDSGAETAQLEPEAPQDVVEGPDLEPYEVTELEANPELDEQTLFSPRRAFTEAMRENMGLPKFDSYSSRSLAGIYQEAKEQGFAEQNKVHELISMNREELTPHEAYGLSIRAAELLEQHKETTARIESGESTIEQEDAGALAAAENELYLITEKLDKAGSLAGLRLVSQKLNIGHDFSAVSALLQAKSKAKGDLTEKQRFRITEAAKEYERASEAVKEAEREASEAYTMESALEGAKSRKAPSEQEFKENLSLLDRLLDGGCHLG